MVLHFFNIAAANVKFCAHNHHGRRPFQVLGHLLNERGYGPMFLITRGQCQCQVAIFCEMLTKFPTVQFNL